MLNFLVLAYGQPEEKRKIILVSNWEISSFILLNKIRRSKLYRYNTHFIVDRGTFMSVSSRIFPLFAALLRFSGIDLILSNQRISHRQNASPSWKLHRLRVFIWAHFCRKGWTWYHWNPNLHMMIIGWSEASTVVYYRWILTNNNELVYIYIWIWFYILILRRWRLCVVGERSEWVCTNKKSSSVGTASGNRLHPKF